MDKSEIQYALLSELYRHDGMATQRYLTTVLELTSAQYQKGADELIRRGFVQPHTSNNLSGLIMTDSGCRHLQQEGRSRHCNSQSIANDNVQTQLQ